MKLNEQGLSVLVEEINRSINTKVNEAVGSGVDINNLATKDELNTTNLKIKNLKANEIAIEDTDNLFTSSDIEGALKEVMFKANESFQQASDGKEKIAQAITGKGVSASSSNTFDELSVKIGQISTGGKSASGTIENFEHYGGSWEEKVINKDFGFTPSLVIVTFKDIKAKESPLYTYASNYTLSSILGSQSLRTPKSFSIYFNITDISENMFKIKYRCDSGDSRIGYEGIDWYAYE